MPYAIVGRSMTAIADSIAAEKLAIARQNLQTSLFSSTSSTITPTTAVDSVTRISNAMTTTTVNASIPSASMSPVTMTTNERMRNTFTTVWDQTLPNCFYKTEDIDLVEGALTNMLMSDVCAEDSCTEAQFIAMYVHTKKKTHLACVVAFSTCLYLPYLTCLWMNKLFKVCEGFFMMFFLGA